MNKVLIIVDMQHDFIDGSLGTPEAQAIIPYVKERISSFSGHILFTQDSHDDAYMESLEGHNLPVPHCQVGTQGHRIHHELEPLITTKQAIVIDKDTFGSKKLVQVLIELHALQPIESIELIGLCTDICVISNALLIKAFLPNIPIIVDSKGCAGVNPTTHQNALEAMKMCQIKII